MPDSLEDLWNRVAEIERRLGQLEEAQKSQPASQPPVKQQSLREFLLAKKPSTAWKKALIVAYFLEKFSSVSPFNLDDLRKGFAQAKEPLPSNPSDMLYQSVKMGYLMESTERKGNSKSWVVTNLGERLVEGQV